MNKRKRYRFWNSLIFNVTKPFPFFKESVAASRKKKRNQFWSKIKTGYQYITTKRAQ